MIPKAIDALTKADIDALVAGQVREARTIEYKQALPGNSDADKRELLADVSSLANAAGGDLIYGITATDGVPQAATGLAGVNVDAEILRLESIIRDGVDPRIPGIRTRPIEGFAQGPVLVLRIPKSWRSPHVVKFGGLSRFYTRSSNGKHQMDVTEIRAAFALSEALPARIGRFRDERLAKIVAEETPVRLAPNPKTVLHVIPVSAFALEDGFTAEEVASVCGRLPTIRGTSVGWRYNFDGCLGYGGAGADPLVKEGYVQMYRSGIIESVDARMLREQDSRRLISGTICERRLVSATSSYLAALTELGLQPPVWIAVSLTGVRGYEMAVAPELTESFEATPIDRDMLLLPEVLVERLDCDAPGLLRPIFDALWNAAGLPRSLSYDEAGNWRPRTFL